VRELRNIIERASLLAENGPIETTHLPETVRLFAGEDDVTRASDACRPLRTAQDAALRQAIQGHRGSRRDLAHKLGLSERSLYRKLRALGDSSANGGDPGSR
jgi:two-component system, NtrC family, response regulator HydG